MKAFLHLMEYAGLKTLYSTFRLVPFQTCMRLADFFSPALALSIPFRKKIILENLRRAFPDKSERFLRHLLKKIYRNFYLFMMEFIHFEKRSREELSGQFVEFIGEEYIREAGVGDKGFLIITGHLGNWELMGAYFASRDYRFSVLAKPVHNPYIDKLITRVREEKGIHVISTRNLDLKSIFKTIREGNGLVFLADQDARRDGIFIDFFGTPASTFTGPAVLSLRTGLPLLPVFDVRKDLLTHKVIFYPPIYPPSGDREKAILKIMTDYTRILEDVIRKYPDQYFWFHRRWKTRPKCKM
ncbi:lysophospholipid acyltransferase family protein [Candidatus Sumerlaeota bacterium]|nr:lysophospholipid acyltransferase family protein [Candidatus Sumerlaeota bacterium]